MWSLSGADAGRFSVDDPGGALRFSIEPTGDDLFLQLPDFDDPLDDDSDGTYELTVHVEGGGDQQTLDVEVTVTDEPEPGTLALSSTRPQLGETLTATLTDLDGVTGTVTYLWERSVGRGTWAALADTAASHVPTAADTGRFLRVTATYEDGHATANTATARTSEVVTADRLTALAVSTTDSTANPGHALRPSFDAGTLHYSIGCAASDTMTLSPTAGTGVRLSINGTQVTSGESHTVAVEADSEVRVTLAAASGAATTYFVRCLSGDLLDMTATTASGATGVIEDLIMFGVSKNGEQSVAIVDANGAVRFHDKDANWSGGYVRAAWVSAAGEYRYAYYKVGQKWQILDQNLEFIASVATVAPLTDTNRHDMTLLDDGNYILMAYEPVDRDLSELTFGTFGTSVRMRDSAIQIRTPGGTPLLTWSSHDAIPFEDCKPKFPPEQADYAHLNTLQMVDGHIVASFRGCSTVLRIDPDDASSHKVVWRLGLTNLTDEQWDGLGKGPAPLEIIGDAEGQFCGQHGTSLLPNGHLILFDNGVFCMHDPWLDTQLLPRPGGQYSRAVEYALDLDNGEAVFLRDHSLGGARSKAGLLHGHVETLEGGDWLIGWGESGGQPPTESVTQVDPETGEEKFSITLLQAGNSSESIRPIPLSPVALADVLPPLEASIVAGAHTSTVHEGATDRPTVAVAFNRPVVDFASTESAGVSGASIEGVAPLVESGAPAYSYVFTLIPDGDADIGFSLLAGMDCDTDPGGVCTVDNTMLSVVPATHTIVYSTPNQLPDITSEGPFLVDEGETAVAELTADDSDTNAGDLVWSKAGGADSAEFSLTSAGVLTFSAAKDYEAPDDADGDGTYEVTVQVSDGSGSDSADLVVTVENVVEPPAVTVSFGQDTYAAPEGSSIQITLTLSTDPERTVEVPLTITDQGGASSADYSVTPDKVTFNSGETSQPFTFTAADDTVDDDGESVKLGFDALPTGVTPSGTTEATVTITDDDTAGVSVSETALTVTEQDATGDTYTVVLDTQPTADVTVTVAGHSGSDVTVSPSSTTLTFTSLNWQTAQTVTVKAGDDSGTANDMVTLTHAAASSDTAYHGITVAGVAVTVNDNDTAQVTGVVVTPGNAQLVVGWAAVPNATGYRVQWKSGGQGYNTGSRQATITSGSTTSHTIGSLMNGTEYTVRVTAVRAGANDGLPSDEMTGIPAVPTAAGVTLSKSTLTVTEQDATGDTYTVVLDTQPTADVTVTVGGHSGTDVTVSPSSGTLTFTSLNWSTAQTVTVKAGDDSGTANDMVTLTHAAASSDTAYHGITVAGVAVTVNDNDTAQRHRERHGDADARRGEQR